MSCFHAKHSSLEFIMPLQLLIKLDLYPRLIEVDLIHKLYELFRQFFFPQILTLAGRSLDLPQP